MSTEEIPDVQNDFINTLSLEQITSPKTFQMILDCDDGFEAKRTEIMIKKRVKKLGASPSDFNELFKRYKRKVTDSRGSVSEGGNKTKFIDQPIELNCGEWVCDVSGVKKEYRCGDGFETKYASPVPVLILERLIDVDDDTHKVKIAVYEQGAWKTSIVENATISNATKIVNLSNGGFIVNSNNSKMLIDYFETLLKNNLDIIPLHQAVNYLGWVGNEFVPYNEEIKFDGEKENRPLFDSVCSCGDYKEWVEYVSNLRKNKLLRLQMAASFASPLIKRLETSPFIFHLWGKTGGGKTVALMVAMSIWGNPQKGKMWRTLNNTINYIMQTSAVFHSFPVGLDELQTIKSFNTSYDTLIMRLCSGVNRGRMSYNNIEKTQSWECAFLTTGEEPILKENSGAGSLNRVIEVETNNQMVVDNGNEVVSFITENYGNAGKVFIQNIKTENLKVQYNEIFKAIMNTCDTTEKQAMTMACILLGDKMAVKYIFKDEKPLKIDDIKEYMKSATDINIAERAYTYIINFIAVNQNRFSAPKENAYGEIWGKIDGDYIFINKTVLEKSLNDEGFVFDAIKNEWAEKGYLIKNSQGRFLHNTHCYGIKALYVKLKNHYEIKDIKTDDLPFEE